MDILLITVVALVALALVFDFTNGFHDAANTVATVVATRALPAKWAPAFAAFFNFTAYFIVGTAVASTIAKTVKTTGMDQSMVIKVIFAALFAAIAWNYLTWFFGMPSSSSHAIIGGLVGAGLAAGGLDAISWDSVAKSAAGIIASPLVAIVVASLVLYLLVGIAKLFKLHDNHASFKGVQLFSSAWMSFGHGANDAQKTMGVIGALLVGTGYVEMGDDGKIPIPEWAALGAYSAIAIGTLWGGWKIIETMGLKITTLNAISGAAANIGAAVSIQGATSAGVPISTTHAAASSVVGAGVASGRGANWKVVGEMVTAWVLTIPAAATIAFLMTQFTQLPDRPGLADDRFGGRGLHGVGHLGDVQHHPRRRRRRRDPHGGGARGARSGASALGRRGSGPGGGSHAVRAPRRSARGARRAGGHDRPSLTSPHQH